MKRLILHFVDGSVSTFYDKKHAWTFYPIGAELHEQLIIRTVDADNDYVTLVIPMRNVIYYMLEEHKDDK